MMQRTHMTAYTGGPCYLMITYAQLCNPGAQDVSYYYTNMDEE